MALELNLTLNNNDSIEGVKGKYYPRVEYKGTMSTLQLAKHMAEHNTPYSLGTIQGVLTDMVKCIRELCLNGARIKIENLCIFKCQVKSKPSDSYLGFDIGQNISKVRLTTQSTGDFSIRELTKKAQIDYTSLANSLCDAERPQPEDEDDGD